MDEGKAGNYNDGSGDSDDTDDDDAGDGDSSDSNEVNAGRRGSPTPISGQSKTKRSAKRHLQRSRHSPSVSSTHASGRKRVVSHIHKLSPLNPKTVA